MKISGKLLNQKQLPKREEVELCLEAAATLGFLAEI